MAETYLSHLALYTARPTVRVNGANQERIAGLLLAMEVMEQEDGLSALELKLSNIASEILILRLKMKRWSNSEIE
jgi:hypothetical protein